jgi:hypothetical protein
LAGLTRRIVQAIHLHAVGIQRHGDAFQPGGIERLARAVVHGVFDEDPVAGIEQHGGAQGQGLLRAGQHQHTLGRGTRPPFEIDVVGDGAPQRLHALWVAVQQGFGAVLLQHLPLQPLPGLQRKAARFRHTGRERARCQKVAHAAALNMALPRWLRRTCCGLRSPGAAHCHVLAGAAPAPTRSCRCPHAVR